MGLEINSLSDEQAFTISHRVLLLLQQPVPNPNDRTLFNRWMGEARALGLSWIEGLEYAAWRCNELCQ